MTDRSAFGTIVEAGGLCFRELDSGVNEATIKKIDKVLGTEADLEDLNLYKLCRQCGQSHTQAINEVWFSKYMG